MDFKLISGLPWEILNQYTPIASEYFHLKGVNQWLLNSIHVERPSESEREREEKWIKLTLKWTATKITNIYYHTYTHIHSMQQTDFTQICGIRIHFRNYDCSIGQSVECVNLTTNMRCKNPFVSRSWMIVYTDALVNSQEEEKNQIKKD